MKVRASGLAGTAFTVYNAVLVQGLPVDDPERIMTLAMRDAAGREQGVSYLDCPTSTRT